MSKVTHKRSKADRVRTKLDSFYGEPVTPEERRDILRFCVVGLEQRIRDSSDKANRRALVSQQVYFKRQLRELNTLLCEYPKRDVWRFVAGIFHNHVPPAVWQRAYAEAHELLKKYEAARAAKFSDSE